VVHQHRADARSPSEQLQEEEEGGGGGGGGEGHKGLKLSSGFNCSSAKPAPNQKIEEVENENSILHHGSG
jgi:hypothetical protein